MDLERSRATAVASILPCRRRMAVHSLLIDDAARLMGVSRRTVYYRIREGRLKTIRTRCGSQRVLVSSIEAFMREQAAPKPPPDSQPDPTDSQAESLSL